MVGSERDARGERWKARRRKVRGAWIPSSGREEGWKKRAVGRRSAVVAGSQCIGWYIGRPDVPRRTLHITGTH